MGTKEFQFGTCRLLCGPYLAFFDGKGGFLRVPQKAPFLYSLVGIQFTRWSYKPPPNGDSFQLGVGLLLGRGRGRPRLPRFPTPAEQGQGVLRAEGEAANGLFAGGAQSNVHSPV